MHLNGSGVPSHADGDFGHYFSSLLHRHLQAYWNLSIHFPDIIYLHFVQEFVSIVSSNSGFPWFAARSRATNYPGIKRTTKTKSCTNKFCLKKVLEGFDRLEYGDRGKRKECASVRLASSRTKDRAANYYENEYCGNEIISKTKLESITWRIRLSMMESRLKFRSCHPGTLAGSFRLSSVWFLSESSKIRILQ